MVLNLLSPSNIDEDSKQTCEAVYFLTFNFFLLIKS